MHCSFPLLSAQERGGAELRPVKARDPTCLPKQRLPGCRVDQQPSAEPTVDPAGPEAGPGRRPIGYPEVPPPHGQRLLQEHLPRVGELAEEL